MSRSWRPEVLSMLPAAFLVAVLNLPFWRRFDQIIDPRSVADWLFMGATGLALALLVYLLLLAISVKPIWRAVILLVLPITAAASYFMNQYGVVIDANMVRNVFETDRHEAGDLISAGLILYVGLLGVAPALVFAAVPWVRRPFQEDGLQKLKFAGVAGLVLIATVFPFLSTFLPVVREHRELKMVLSPYNYVSALATYWRRQSPHVALTVARFGDDAVRPSDAAAKSRKSVFVIVVGETARADHFALNGYPRPTNPELSKIADVIDFPKAYSCGTDTAQSVPCMFSGLGIKKFSNAAAAAQENLLDILKRTGIDVVWRDNQAGCKGVCERVPSENLTGLKHPTFYLRSENVDEILLDGLEARLASVQRDTVIVLHMMGSHGPAYWKRYPARFETFTPVCKESQFSRCSSAEIINGYDNTIVYTDHVLASLIKILSNAASANLDTGMIYMSDHGESLGENNMYLHGMPYAIAPEAQIHIPMVLWLSPAMREGLSIDQRCLADHAHERVSHDNLFHSVLGLMKVSTRVYDAKLDLFAACRSPKS